MTIPLTKTLDPADFDQLPQELGIVDAYFSQDAVQHPARRWEYALALDAVCRWRDQQTKYTYHAVDVGGAGSPFWRMLDAVGRAATVIDPAENYDLASYMADLPRLSPVVTCLSVLEHVEDLDRFVYHLGCLVAPGGLLFLTVDFTDLSPNRYPDDTCHFHWMRQRIFNRYSLNRLVLGPLLADHFALVGPADLDWHGAHVFDYSFASLCLQKRS
jgi:Methyltransferase domain